MRLHFIVSAPLALVLLATSSIGCSGTSASAICADVCECTGCSEQEETDCVDAIEDAEKAAADEGCEDAWDDYVSCASDELECRDGVARSDGCDAEGEALAECTDGASVGGFGANLCERAAEICGGGSSGEGAEVECSGATQCAATCIVDANSCDTSDQGLIDCITDCSG